MVDVARHTPVEILITGAGIAGPTLAYWLSRIPSEAPLVITILERSPTPRITGQSIDIRGPAVTVIRNMGIENDIRACHTHEQGLQKLDPNGNLLMTLSSTGDSSRQSFTSEFEILRADLVRVICDTAAKMPGVKFVYGDSISSMKEDGEGGKVHVEFTNGKLPDSDYDLVVGADGVMSRIRSLITGRPVKEDLKMLNNYCALFTIPREASDSTTHASFAHFGNKRWVMTRPSSAGLGVYLMIGPALHKNEELERATEQQASEQRAAIERAFADRPGTGRIATARLLEGMHTAPDFYYQNIVQVHARKWCKGRLAVVGDAACCPSAQSGMGTSAALYGAYVLAGELAGALSQDGDGSIPAALERYERTARPYLMKLQNIAEAVQRFLCPSTTWGVRVLDTVCWFIGIFRVIEVLTWIILKFPQAKEDMTLPEYKWTPA